MSLYETHKLQEQKIPMICKECLFLADGPSDAGNWHENIEIVLVTEGEGIIVNHDCQLNVKTNDIIVVNANCLHSFSTNTRLGYIYLIVDRAFCLANHLDTNRIRFEMQFCDPELAALMKEIYRKNATNEPIPYAVPMIRADLLRLIVLLCRRHGNETDEPMSDSRLLFCIKQAIGYLHSESCRDISLEEVATLVGFSKFYFSREFRRITGYTFLSYVNLIRCEKAKQLLAESDLSIGEIGRVCGFDNQSYFSKTFLKRTGMLPSAYRQEQRKQKKG